MTTVLLCTDVSLISLSLQCSGSECSSKQSGSSVNSSPSCTPLSPKEGSEVLSDDEQDKPIEELSLSAVCCHDQKSIGDLPISPKSSPISESSFAKMSEVYTKSPQEQFSVEPQSNAGLPVSVSPHEAKCFFPETTTNQDYVVPSSDTASSYYEATARNFYSNTAYPTATSYNTMFTGPSDSPMMATGGAMYTNSCVSPGYISSYPGSKGYAWSPASNGMGYGFRVPQTADMYQYQAQTAAYQQMASRSSYPGYIATGATTPTVMPNTIV